MTHRKKSNNWAWRLIWHFLPDGVEQMVSFIFYRVGQICSDIKLSNLFWNIKNESIKSFVKFLNTKFQFRFLYFRIVEKNQDYSQEPKMKQLKSFVKFFQKNSTADFFYFQLETKTFRRHTWESNWFNQSVGFQL